MTSLTHWFIQFEYQAVTTVTDCIHTQYIPSSHSMGLYKNHKYGNCEFWHLPWFATMFHVYCVLHFFVKIHKFLM